MDCRLWPKPSGCLSRMAIVKRNSSTASRLRWSRANLSACLGPAAQEKQRSCGRFLALPSPRPERSPSADWIRLATPTRSADRWATCLNKTLSRHRCHANEHFITQPRSGSPQTLQLTTFSEPSIELSMTSGSSTCGTRRRAFCPEAKSSEAASQSSSSPSRAF